MHKGYTTYIANSAENPINMKVLFCCKRTRSTAPEIFKPLGCGLNVKILHRLMCFDTWSPAVGVLWKGYGPLEGESCLEEVHVSGWVLELDRQIILPVLSLILSC